MKLEFDIGAMNLGDFDDFEGVAGAPVSAMSKYGEQDDGSEGLDMPMRFIIAMVYISERAKNPKFTVADARAVKFSDLIVEISDSSEPDTPKDEENSELSAAS